MKILYIISSLNAHSHAIVGGHYYSLKVISEAMSQHNEVLTLAIMPKESPVINSYNHRHEYIFSAGKTTKQLIKKLMDFVRREKPDVLHSMDTPAHLMAKKVSQKTGTPLILTKAGGPPSRHSYPYSKDIVLFTRDDYEHYKKNPMLRRARLHLMPNRANPPVINEARFSEMPSMEGFFNVMTINRFEGVKRSTIIQTINFVEYLRQHSVRARAIIIGRRGHEPLLAEVRSKLDKDDLVFTEEPYIVSASEYLPLADAVVAVGRGAMEALGYGKPVFCPSSTDGFPFLLDDATIELALASNFTERTRISLGLNARLECALRLARDDVGRDRAAKRSLDYFRTYCDIANAVHKYQEIYKNAECSAYWPMERLVMITASMISRYSRKVFESGSNH